jgi:hypothetical protein
MPTAIGGDNVYPSLQEIANQVRTILNDDGAGATGTVGEGQIVVNNSAISVKLPNAMNLAIGQVHRELRNSGSPLLIADNYIVTGLPVVNGVNGSAAPDASAQVCLGYTGFFDGTQMWPDYKLPINMLMPERMWQRQTGTNLPFTPMEQAQFGLAPVYQGVSLGQWEWRSDGLWMNGSTVNCDIRLRYQLKLNLFYGQNINYNTTYVPIQDCVAAVAYKAAYIIDFSLGSEVAPMLGAQADKEIAQLQNESVRRAQTIDYSRIPYGDDGGYDGFL